MNLGKAGWLGELLEEAVRAHRPRPADPGPRSPRARAKAVLRRKLRDTGLAYGTPADLGALPETTTAPEERLFLAVLRTLAALALEIADQVGAPEARRELQLLALFAALTGQVEEAEALAQRAEPASRRSGLKVEAALAERAISLAGDPVYGLVLHNGAVYVDAQVFDGTIPVLKLSTVVGRY